MTELPQDTICAVSTPPGVGGIAVVRVSGPQAIAVCDRLWHGCELSRCATHTAHLGEIHDSAGAVLDQAVATVYRGPRSFTGEDVVELSVHGSRYVQQALLTALVDAGARLAAPGEFTRRAYANGRLDLAQAEAVADVIASESRAAHRVAMRQMRGGFSQRLQQLRGQLVDIASLLELELDFSEEDVEFASRERLLQIATDVQTEVQRLARSFGSGQAIKDGIPVAIVGATNAGKSSLLNALLGDDRAIVSDVHGTTRDVVEDRITLGDYTYRIMDTAGLRLTSDTVEALGIERSHKAMRQARLVLLVIDATAPMVPQTFGPADDAAVIVVVNKCDLPASPALSSTLASIDVPVAATVRLSARTGEGLDALTGVMTGAAVTGDSGADTVLVTNARHYQALLRASESIATAIDGIRDGLSGDLIAIDIRLTLHHLGEILGQITNDELLATIFSRFCIGK